MHIVLSVPETGGELWLGSIAASGQVKVLHENGISAIVAAAAKPPVAHDSCVKHLATLDGTGVSTGTVPLKEVLRTFEEILKILKGGGKVLISCKNGAHRSSLLTAMFLIYASGSSAQSVRDYLVSLRNIVDLDSMPPAPKYPNQIRGDVPMKYLVAVEQCLKEEASKVWGGFQFELNKVVTPSAFKKLAVQFGYEVLSGFSKNRSIVLYCISNPKPDSSHYINRRI